MDNEIYYPNTIRQSVNHSTDAGYSANHSSFNRQPIALISDHGDPAAEIGFEEAGGQNVYVRYVGETLAKLGWQVDMFTRKVKSDDPTIVQHSPHCRTIRLVAGPERFIPRDEIFEYMPQFVDAFEAFCRHERICYPLIHTNYWLSAWIGLQLKARHQIQLVHTYHSLGAVKYKTLTDQPAIAPIRLNIEKQILEQADCIIATSPQEQEYLRTLVSKKGNVKIIPYGTDVETFHTIPKAEARAKLGLDGDEQIVLYVGRFDPRKGIETLIRASAQTKAFAEGRLKLVIVGGSCPDRIDGQERNRIEHIVQETGLTEKTLFAGQVKHNMLLFYYAAADVCVIPSHYEPFGLVAIEAMVCGTPVIASDVGGLKFTVLSEQTGLRVSPQDTAAFATAIDRLLTNKAWARQLGTCGSLQVNQQFSWTKIASQLSRLYQFLLLQKMGLN
ncbi:MAG TPA: glycoside hydrolase [Cyanobacteria bacterium UBA8543]|nr:glycoside hydrolase [Cyanobacteria bacterium UBA8543]